MEPATWVIAFGTLVLAVATFALVWATRALVDETRTARKAAREAEVGVLVEPWEEFGNILAITIANYGPANAYDMRFGFRLIGLPDGVRSEWSLTEPTFPKDRHRTTLIKAMEIDALIKADASVMLEWSWTTANKEARHEQREWSIADVAAGVRSGGALLQRDYLREIPKIRDELQKIAQTLATKGDTSR